MYCEKMKKKIVYWKLYLVNIRYICMIKLYTDGSAKENPGKCSWAYVLVKLTSKNPIGEVIAEGSGVIEEGTVPLSELYAFYTGAIESKSKGYDAVYAYSDSKYVVDGYNKWMEGWKKRGWKLASGDVVKNKELWCAIDRSVSNIVDLQWVKSHDGNYWNEYVDNLAKSELI